MDFMTFDVKVDFLFNSTPVRENHKMNFLNTQGKFFFQTFWNATQLLIDFIL